MFEELFTGPIAQARQRTSPLPEARRGFLSHLKDLGYARNSLHAVACELVVIVRHLDLFGQTAVDLAVVEGTARRWATHQSRRRGSATTARAARNFRYWATQWLRWLGRLKAPVYQGLLAGFTTCMR